jgi:hypothetical protein
VTVVTFELESGYLESRVSKQIETGHTLCPDSRQAAIGSYVVGCAAIYLKPIDPCFINNYRFWFSRFVTRQNISSRAICLLSWEGFSDLDEDIGVKGLVCIFYSYWRVG